MPGGNSREIAMFLCGTECFAHALEHAGGYAPARRARTRCGHPAAVDQISPDLHTDHFDVDADQAVEDSEVHRRACACSGVPGGRAATRGLGVQRAEAPIGKLEIAQLHCGLGNPERAQHRGGEAELSYRESVDATITRVIHFSSAPWLKSLREGT